MFLSGRLPMNLSILLLCAVCGTLAAQCFWPKYSMRRGSNCLTSYHKESEEHMWSCYLLNATTTRVADTYATDTIKINREGRDIKEANPRRGELEIQSIYWSNIKGLACLMRSSSFT